MLGSVKTCYLWRLKSLNSSIVDYLLAVRHHFMSQHDSSSFPWKDLVMILMLRIERNPTRRRLNRVDKEQKGGEHHHMRDGLWTGELILSLQPPPLFLGFLY